MDLDRELAKDALYGSRGNAMSFGDLGKTLALAWITLDGGIVQLQRIAADVAAFELGASQAGADPLYDQVALQFSNGADDDHDGSAQWAASIEIFPEADVLDIEPADPAVTMKMLRHKRLATAMEIYSHRVNSQQQAAQGLYLAAIGRD